MKKLLIVLPCLVACVAMLGFMGCESGGSSDDDVGEGAVIVARGTKRNLRVGVIDSAVTIRDQGAGTLSAEASWSTNRRIRAVLTISGPGTIIADTTTTTSPFTISTAVEAGNTHILYLGNPDGPDVLDVDYTVYFAPAATE